MSIDLVLAILTKDYINVNIYIVALQYFGNFMENVTIQKENIKNNASSFFETQQFINKLVGASIQSNISDVSFDHGRDFSHSHINLDILQTVVEYDDLASARIYPNHITTFNKFAYTVESMLADSEMLKKNLETIFKKIRYFSIIGIEASVKHIILLDKYCEELILWSAQYLSRISDTVSNKLDLVKPNLTKHIVEQLELRVERPRVHSVQITSYTDSHFETIPVRFKTKNNINEVVEFQKDVKHEQKSTFSRVCVLLYTELRYGGVLRDIDSI